MTDKYNPHKAADHQKEVDDYAAEQSRITDARAKIWNSPEMVFVRAMQAIWSRPPGFKKGRWDD